jgi:hypothetical protein
MPFTWKDVTYTIKNPRAEKLYNWLNRRYEYKSKPFGRRIYYSFWSLVRALTHRGFPSNEIPTLWNYRRCNKCRQR